MKVGSEDYEVMWDSQGVLVWKYTSNLSLDHLSHWTIFTGNTIMR